MDSDQKAIITWRVWQENWLTRRQIRDVIKSWAPTNNYQLCMIPDTPSNFDTTGIVTAIIVTMPIAENIIEV